MLSGGRGGIDTFTRINSMGNVYLLLPGSAISCVFSLIGPLRGMRARYNGALLARNNAFAESKLRYLVACKYTASNERELLAAYL